MKTNARLLVFDVGATRTRVALAQDGELGDVWRSDTDTTAAGFARFAGLLQDAAKSHAVNGVVGGLPGQLEGKEGRLTLATNLPDWLGLPVGQRLRGLFDCPVTVRNDVELNGLGEARSGAGIKTGVMAYVTVSTGVNAVRLVNGRLDETISRFELGKLIIGNDGDGRPESLEAQTSGTALARRAGRPPRELRDRAVWQIEERELARGVYDLALAWTPELIVFGGSMMRDIDLAAVRREFEALPVVLAAPPRLANAKLGDAAGLWGALAWWEQQTKR